LIYIIVGQMREFKVNKFITLKLEEEIINEEEDLKDIKTIIYVNGKEFRQCTFLLINIPVDEQTPLDEIDSIDEAEERLGTSLEDDDELFKYNIPPETAFWGHCSNLQAWAENNYDTRLLHRNLAFPMLKELTELGDPTAKRVFKEEIAERFTSCYIPVVDFLLFGGYLDYLLEEELETLFNEIKSRNHLLFSYIEPELLFKGYINYNFTTEEFGKYLTKFLSECEKGKYIPLDIYEEFGIGSEHSIVDWLTENIWMPDLRKRRILK